MTLRGRAAVVGIGEVPTRRLLEGRTLYGLCAEAAKLAINDAGLRKQDIDGLVTDGGAALATMGRVHRHQAKLRHRSLHAGSQRRDGYYGRRKRDQRRPLRDCAGRDGQLSIIPGQSGGGASVRSEWEEPYGMAPGAGTGYALIYNRHMYEYGTTQEQMAKVAADQRFNAVENPNAVFNGQSATVQDVLNSRYVNYPLRLLECVMPCDGAAALIMTTPERAKALPNRPAYLLGSGLEQSNANIWQTDRITTTPVAASAKRAFNMAGYAPADMQFAEFYD